MDASKCPLCGDSNQCAAEQQIKSESKASLDCWCFRTAVPQELRALIPKEMQGKACICSRCVEEFHARARPYQE